MNIYKLYANWVKNRIREIYDNLKGNIMSRIEGLCYSLALYEWKNLVTKDKFQIYIVSY